MSNFPRIHNREYIVRNVSLQLKKQLMDAIEEHNLTEGEQLRICVEVYSEWVGGMAKYMIRDERHGDPNKCGGLAYNEEKKEFEVEGFLKDSDPPPAKEE